jgi:hypothetical protein
MISKLIIIIIVLLVGSSQIAATASTVKAGDTNCDTDPDDPRCTGEKGMLGMSFCTPEYPEGDCYSRDYVQEIVMRIQIIQDVMVISVEKV